MNKLFYDKLSMQQAIKFELIDSNGFLTFEGLEYLRKVGL